MPELPEVEAVARTLRPLIRYRRIRCVHVLHPIVTRPQSATHLSLSAQSRLIKSVSRIGKYLLISLDRGLLTMHFRFDGHLVWFSSAAELFERANLSKNGVHVDLAFELNDGVLAFADPRHFGRVHAWPSAEDSPSVAALGTDALSRRFTLATFRELLASSSRPLKGFLLDQSRVAGIGNIYSSEALWLARLDPRRPSHRLHPEDSRRLYKAIVSVLARALECCLDPAPDFRNSDWWFQGLERVLRVYGRKGKPCRRCGEPIRRMLQGGRSTYYCGHCQR